MEVKFDHFFPAYLKRLLSGLNVERMAISKYTLARTFHKINKWEETKKYYDPIKSNHEAYIKIFEARERILNGPLKEIFKILADLRT